MDIYLDTTVGSDPEVICVLTDRRPERAAHNGMLPASFVLDQYKDVVGEPNPFVTFGELFYDNGDFKSVSVNTNTGMIFADGASFEINPFPHVSVGLFVGNVAGMMSASQAILDAVRTDYADVTLKVVPAIDFKLDMLKFWGNPQLAIFGCDPDKSIHPRVIDPSQIDAANHPTRYFGGHIHIGLNGLLNGLNLGNMSIEEYLLSTPNAIVDITWLFDMLCGQIGIMFDRVVDDLAAQRRMVYGQPGVYRPQTHGIEYRTPSNSWLLSKPRTHVMFSVAKWIPWLFSIDAVSVLEPLKERAIAALISGEFDDAYENLCDVADALNRFAGDEIVDPEYILEVTERDVYTWQTEWLDQ